MKRIVACLFLILAVSTLTFMLAPTASSQTSDIKILSYSHYIDNLGNIVVVGEVQNTGSNIFQNVTLSGTVSGSDGSQVPSGCWISATNFLPGQKSSFYMEFYPQNTASGSWSGVDITDVSLSVYTAPTTTQYQYQNVTITSNSPKLIDGVYWVNCTLKNTGDQTATNIMLLGTFYNSSGAVVAVGDIVNPLASLAPQATVTANVPAFDLNQTIIPDYLKISAYSLLVQVQMPLLSGNAPVINPSATPYAGPSLTSSTGNQTSGGGDSTMTYVAVGVVVAVVVVLAAVFLLRRRRPEEKSADKPEKTVKPHHTSRRNRK